jgi:hypothetical protein
LFLAALFSQPTVAQVLVSPKHSCSYDGKRLPGNTFAFASDDEAQAAINNIMKYTGLAQNFKLYASNVDNAEATMLGKRADKRAILYNQRFMLRVRDATHSDWAALSILAHEIGHHLNNHVLGPVLGSIDARHQAELEADRFSGFVLANMGASLEESQLAMNSIGSDLTSASHPARATRLDAIANGWILANNLSQLRMRGQVNQDQTAEAPKGTITFPAPEFPTSERPKDSAPFPTSTNSSKPGLQFEFIFDSGSFGLLFSKYFARHDGEVIEYPYNDFGKGMSVGRWSKTRGTKFCTYEFRIGFFKYCVTNNNVIRPITQGFRDQLNKETEMIGSAVGRISSKEILHFDP